MAEIKITAHDGGTFNAYIARPKNKSAAPVIIVIQEIFGVNAEMREKCDALARQGSVIYPRDGVEQQKAQPVGTGPFALERWFAIGLVARISSFPGFP